MTVELSVADFLPNDVFLRLIGSPLMLLHICGSGGHAASEALPLFGHGEIASWCSGSPAPPAASVRARPGMSLRLEGQMGSWQSLSSRG